MTAIVIVMLFPAYMINYDMPTLLSGGLYEYNK